MRKKPSKILEAVHATAKGLHAAGAIDQVTMREFDHLSLAPAPPLRPAQIKRIRETSKVSQAVFAALLNTSVSTVQKWEIGQKRCIALCGHRSRHGDRGQSAAATPRAANQPAAADVRRSAKRLRCECGLYGGARSARARAR